MTSFINWVCQLKASGPLPLPGSSIRMADYTAWPAKVERGLALPLSLPYCGYIPHQFSFKFPSWWQEGLWLHGASTTFINDAGDATTSLAKTDRGREEGPLNWTALWVSIHQPPPPTQSLTAVQVSPPRLPLPVSDCSQVETELSPSAAESEWRQVRWGEGKRRR